MKERPEFEECDSCGKLSKIQFLGRWKFKKRTIKVCGMTCAGNLHGYVQTWREVGAGEM
jgi:hypothetical protein